MRDALAPHSSDSIMPSMAMETIGLTRFWSMSRLTAPRFRRLSNIRLFGMSPTFASESKPAISVTMVARIIASSDPGTFAFSFFGQKTMNSTTSRPMATACQLGGKSDAGVAPQLFQRACADGVRAEEVVHLPQGDDNRDAAGEAHDDAGRDEVDELAEAEDARQQDNHARRKRRDEHALQAVLGDDADEDGAHGPGRAADLEATRRQAAR